MYSLSRSRKYYQNHHLEMRNQQADYYSQFPERNQARRIAKRALALGQLEPQQCQVCNSSAEMHHPNYSEPLQVVWLCRKHHNGV